MEACNHIQQQLVSYLLLLSSSSAAASTYHSSSSSLYSSVYQLSQQFVTRYAWLVLQLEMCSASLEGALMKYRLQQSSSRTQTEKQYQIHHHTNNKHYDERLIINALISYIQQAHSVCRTVIQETSLSSPFDRPSRLEALCLLSLALLYAASALASASSASVSVAHSEHNLCMSIHILARLLYHLYMSPTSSAAVQRWLTYAIKHK